MSAMAVVILLFAAGIVILIAEIFIPSHGILGVVGLGFLAFAIYRAYELGESKGHVAIVAAVVLVPTLAIVAVKNFRRTPMGRKIVPDNPTVRVEEFAPHYENLKDVLGRTGQSVTPLRPVGTCMFEGERVNCVAESGMIAKGAMVEAVGIRGHEVEVRLVDSARA